MFNITDHFSRTLYFILFQILICIFSLRLSGQNNYWVFLKDKHRCEFDPYKYFDSKALERRVINNIPLFDSSDFPVNQDYVSLITGLVEKADFQSRWFNAIAVDAYPDQICLVSELPFVREVQLCETSGNNLCNVSTDTDIFENFPELLDEQISSMQGEFFSKGGITGKGVRIAVFDAGFPDVDTHKAFRHLRENGRIIKTHDFVKNRENVYSKGMHGRMVLSCITGLYDGKKIGLATDAEFLLARTEHTLIEPFSEEKNWLAAAEWADKNGAQIINSSLGYYYHRYFNDQMNGKSSLVARAATMAARKGILVVTAMGNEGDGNWKFLVTPADADSVLSVGGINPNTRHHISFSSYGPTSDKRMKPNVSAFGVAVVASSDSLEISQGTSFSTPLVCGFAACVLQIHPEYSNMKLLEEVEKSGTLYPYFDYAHGFGIPQAGYFTGGKKQNNDTSLEISLSNDSLFIKINPGLIRTDSLSYLYYHIRNRQGFIEKYAVLKVNNENVLQIPVDLLKNDEVVMVHYLGYSKEITLKDFN